jgi:hypothetical protein
MEIDMAEQKRRLMASAQAALDAAHADFETHRCALEDRVMAAERATERAVAELAAERAALERDRGELLAAHAATVAQLQERVRCVRSTVCYWRANWSSTLSCSRYHRRLGRA